MATETVPGRRLPRRETACVLPLMAVAAWAVWSWPIVEQGMRRLLTADRPWLAAAAAASALAWVAAAFARQGAVTERLPPVRLLATQPAASSANHLLPSDVGAGAVNLRFLTVRGLPPARSSAALALYCWRRAWPGWPCCWCSSPLSRRPCGSAGCCRTARRGRSSPRAAH